MQHQFPGSGGLAVSDDSAVAGLPADFEQRCAATLARLRSGERMTVEYLASQLSLTTEFLAIAMQVYRETVDLSHARPLH